VINSRAHKYLSPCGDEFIYFETLVVDYRSGVGEVIDVGWFAAGVAVFDQRVETLQY